jgi:hypothetical protein
MQIQLCPAHRCHSFHLDEDLDEDEVEEMKGAVLSAGAGMYRVTAMRACVSRQRCASKAVFK